jgi:hypothetical protein
MTDTILKQNAGRGGAVIVSGTTQAIPTGEYSHVDFLATTTFAALPSAAEMPLLTGLATTTSFPANSSLKTVLDITGPNSISVSATLPDFGTLEGAFNRIGELNSKPYYQAIPPTSAFVLKYTEGRWNIFVSTSYEPILADVGDEPYPWLATWPSGNSVIITPSSTPASITGTAVFYKAL